MTKEGRTQHMSMLTFVGYAVVYCIHQWCRGGMLDLLQHSQQPLPLKSHVLEVLTADQQEELPSALLHVSVSALNMNLIEEKGEIKIE